MHKLILFFITLTLFSACGKEKEVEEKKLKPVVYEIVQSQKDSILRSYSGVITSEALSNLSFRVSGTINNRIAKLGDNVKSGEILATLDPAEYKLKYQQAIADLNKSKALLIEAEANFKRSQALYLENSVSKASYDQAVANYKSSVSSVNALKESVNLAQLQLDYTNLKAPSDGTIGQVKSEVNETITPNTTIFVLNTSGKKFIEFYVSQSVIGSLKMNQSVDITISSLNNMTLKGNISNIGTISTGFGNTYPVKVELEEPHSPLIKIGMIGTVNINISETDNKIVKIPISSVLTDADNNKYVYCIKDIDKNEGTAQKQIITLGEIGTGSVVVNSGLKSGDYIITKGGNHILQGEKVILLAKGDDGI